MIELIYLPVPHQRVDTIGYCMLVMVMATSGVLHLGLCEVCHSL